MHLVNEKIKSIYLEACPDSNGFIYDEKGIDFELVKELKERDSKRISEYVHYNPHAFYRDEVNIWTVPCH